MGADLANLTLACGFLLIITGLVLSALPVGECDRCVHCQGERHSRYLRTLCPQHRKPRSECIEEHRP